MADRSAVTAAALAFAFTMASMGRSEMRAIDQFGSAVCVGLLLDRLIVRSRRMPWIATLLGAVVLVARGVHPGGGGKPPHASSAATKLPTPAS